MYVSVLAVKAGCLWLHTNIHRSTVNLEELRATTVPATIAYTDSCGCASIPTDTLKQLKTPDSQENCIFTWPFYWLLIKKAKEYPKSRKEL